MTPTPTRQTRRLGYGPLHVPTATRAAANNATSKQFVAQWKSHNHKKHLFFCCCFLLLLLLPPLSPLPSTDCCQKHKV
jgi:hypothetical protein